MPVGLAYCGVDCTTCPAHIATSTNNEQLRIETAAEWSKMYNADIKPKDIHCQGCTSGSEDIFHHCTVCEIRSCGIEKKVINCGHCIEYPCEKLSNFFANAPEAKKNLDLVNSEISGLN